MLIKLRIFYHNHHPHIFDILLRICKKITCVQHVLGGWQNLFFFLWLLESSCFPLVTIYPKEKNAYSYLYCSIVFRIQWPQLLAFFSIFSSSVNSFYYLLYYWIIFSSFITLWFSSRDGFNGSNKVSLYLSGK